MESVISCRKTIIGINERARDAIVLTSDASNRSRLGATGIDIAFLRNHTAAIDSCCRSRKDDLFFLKTLSGRSIELTRGSELGALMSFACIQPPNCLDGFPTLSWCGCYLPVSSLGYRWQCWRPLRQGDGYYLKKLLAWSGLASLKNCSVQPASKENFSSTPTSIHNKID
jgi:hypothetical protein